MKMKCVEYRVSSVECPEALPQAGRSGHASRATRHAAFTLMEVMIASAIFFMAMFSVLALVAGTLRNARALQKRDVDPGILAARLSSQYTKLTDGSADSGDFEDYPGYTWSTNVFEIPNPGENPRRSKLFQADLSVSHRAGNQNVETRMSILLFRPLSTP